MEQELERIFRLMALLLPQAGLHDAYVGVRSSNPIVRANALEFLDNVLKPELRHVLVPLLDTHVTVARARSPCEQAGGRAARDAAAGGRDAARERRPVAAVVRRSTRSGRCSCEALAPELKRYESASGPAGAAVGARRKARLRRRRARR